MSESEFKAAIDDYTRAVAFIPDLAGAYINRGDVRSCCAKRKVPVRI